ncbi:reverse transcriptase [Phytophthora megakarya]|uniref:Reverse transcriptase n=1 Tax=Phytophthora megakarya TaxID=4795 RepID=A0A225WNC3_9STRA|nr:reverse transcriptase [Phytophthora megakarya]
MDDHGLADQLALLRLTDAEDLKETLRARQRESPYAEWKNLAFQATTDETPMEGSNEVMAEPLVYKPQYHAPTEILKKKPKPRKLMLIQPSPCVGTKIEEPETGGGEQLKPEPDDADHIATEDMRVGQEGIAPRDQADKPAQKTGPPEALVKPDREVDDDMDVAVCNHEGGDIFPEDIENHMAVLQEATMGEVMIEDIWVENPDVTPEECERLRCIIGKGRHLFIEDGNALPPPAAHGAICDIDVGNAKPVAQRCRRVPPQFREKLSMLIKGLLSATIIAPSISPWASPIVDIIKANGVDIRLCIDYHVGRVVFCGDSNLVIRPMIGEIDYWNQSAGKLTSAALQREEGEIVTAEGERQDLITLNRLHEMLQPIQQIKQAQDEEKWIVDLMAYLKGDQNGLSKEDAKTCSKTAATYEVDEDELLFYCPRALTQDEARDDVVTLVISMDMDHIPSLPKFYKGKTELLIWADLFTGYVMTKGESLRGAQAVAKTTRSVSSGGSAQVKYSGTIGNRDSWKIFFRGFNPIVKALRMYVSDVNQQDWDDYAEHLTFALNTAQDRVQKDTSFYRVHGWDARSTLEATLLIGSTRRKDSDAHRWSTVETSETEYRIFHVVHLSKLKLVKAIPDRPTYTLLAEEGGRVDFDEALLPEDIWKTPLDEAEFGVERIADVRSGLRYPEPTWVDEADLNCGALLAEFERTQTNRSRFNVMQSHKEASDNL